ncbi:MerR family transcriptional regulator [Saccharomonospora piscinae]|uniref:MerR family transcriptional regulator n=1 Tax=Saccharomonospora piscinae TaxID=687388 RepID=UPI001FDA0FB4|nr:MerR family transcriptional regulator [Saccharomonospora piscinae]
MSGNTVPALPIGAVAAATGVSARLLRYYEEQNLLAPARTSSGQRRYDESDIERVGRIRRLLDAGLPTNVIAEILACACGGSGDVEPCLDPLLRDQFARLDARLTQLAFHHERLTELTSRPEAFSTNPSDRNYDPGLQLSGRRSQ